MESNFRFTLDDYFVVADEPIGWDRAAVTLKRNKEYGGIFYSYAGEYEFIGDGYKYIVDQIEALGYCFSVKVLVEYRCNVNSPFETAFLGFINIKNAEIDQEKKVVRANIEPDDVYSAFLSMSNTEYNLYTTNMSFPNGNSISLAESQHQYHSIEDGLYYTANLTKTANYFRVFDVLNYLVQANTQGRLSVVSDFFTNAFTQTNKWTVSLGGTTMAAGTINVTFVNQFGQIRTASQSFSISETVTLDLLCLSLVESTSSPVPINDLNIKGFLRNYFTHLSWADFSRSGRVITLESWLPYRIIDVSITGGTPGTTIATAEVQAYQNGGGNLYMTNQEQEAYFLSLPNIGDNRTVSFDKLFKELDAIYYLGMKLERNGNSFVLRIEPMDYFFSQSSIITLEGVMNVKTSFSSADNYNAVNVGSEGEYVTHTYAVQQAAVRGNSGDTFMEIAGDNPTSYIWKYIAVAGAIGREVKQIIAVNPPGGGSFYTIHFKTPLTATTATFADMIMAQFSEKQNNVSLLVSNTVYPIGLCYGSQLQLKNEYCIDTEYHGDQVSQDYDYTLMNGSAAPNENKWTFCLMDPAASPPLSRSMIYKARLINNSILYTRYQFNGHLTNHHKIRNNFSRIKQDCFYQPKFRAAGDGEVLTYINTSDIIPLRIHEFEYALSYNQILSLIANPETKIQFDPDNSGNYISCWIEQIEMDINTKQTRLRLYES